MTLAIFLVVSGSLNGCSATPGPNMLTISPGQYDQAFDAAIEIARQDGLLAAVQDRRAGTIETEPRRAASFFEPWRSDNASSDQALENTLGLQRRTARFEFVPVGYQESALRDDGALTGPDVVNLDGPLRDLTQTIRPLELRVWVYIERAHTAGMRRSTWTRRKTSRSELTIPENEGGLPNGQFWTPFSRDELYEQRLLAGVEKMLVLTNSTLSTNDPATTVDGTANSGVHSPSAP